MAHFRHIKDIFEFCDIFSQLVANYLGRFFLMQPVLLHRITASSPGNISSCETAPHKYYGNMNA